MTQIPANQSIVAAPPVTDPSLTPSATTEDFSAPSAADNGPQFSSPAPSPTVPVAPAQIPQTPQISDPTQPAIPTQPASPSSFRDLLGAEGIDLTGYESLPDADLAKHLAERNRQAEAADQMTPLAQIGQQVVPYQDEFREFMAAKQAQQAQAAIVAPPQSAPAEEAPASYWVKEPEWDQSWEQFLQVNDEGIVVGKQPEFAPLAQKYRDHQAWLQTSQRKLLSDPAEAVWPGLEEKVQGLVETRVQAQIEEYNNQQFANSFIEEYKDVLYQHDSNNRPMIDPQSGRAILSPYGVQFGENVRRLQAAGVINPVEQSEWAMQLLAASVTRDIASSPPAPGIAPQAAPGGVALPPVQTPLASAPVPGISPEVGAAALQPAMTPAQQTQETFLQEAMANAAAQRIPGRGGSIVSSQLPNGPSQNPTEDYETMLTRNMRAAGLMA